MVAVRRQAAYLRVSTAGQSVEAQRESIRQAASARGQSVDLWFSEQAAGDKRRPELERLRSLARRGEVAAVWVFKFDRLSRRGSLDLLQLVDELRGYGCRVVSASEPLDTDSPFAEILLAALGCAAAIELQAIRDRVQAAREKAKKAGKRWGRPREIQDEQVLTLVGLVGEGLSLRKAAKKAGISFASAQRIMAGRRQAKTG